MRIFSDFGINEKGNALPLSEFKLFCDMKEVKLNERKMKIVVEKAEKLNEEEIPLLTASLYRQYTTNGNRSNFEGKYFKRREMLLYLTLAEAYEKKGRFTEKIIDVAWAIMEESTWTVPTHLGGNYPLGGEKSLCPVFGEEKLHGIALFSAATGALLAYVYSILKDSLDEIEPLVCEKIKYMINQRIIMPYLQCSFWWDGTRTQKISNWGIWITSNILFTMAHTVEDGYLREKVLRKAMNTVELFAHSYPNDGGCEEGASYWGAAGASLFDCLETIEDLSGGKIKVYDKDIVRKIGEYIYKVNIDGEKFANFGDCGPKLRPDPCHLLRFGVKCNSEYLANFAKKQASLGDFYASSSHMYRTIKNLVTADIDSKIPKAPKKTWLADLQQMTARECDVYGSGMFVATKGGTNGEYHNHNDVGNFIVYSDGKPVIIDTGVGTYTKQTFSPRRYELWFMQSGYHNIPSFNGIDEAPGIEYGATDVVYDEESGAVKYQLCNAYKPESKLKSFEREIVLKDSKVFVTDDILLSEVSDIDFHFMTHVEPKLIESGKIALTEGRILEYSPELDCEIEGFDPVGMNTKSSWGTEIMYRIHLKAKTDKCKYTFTIS